VRIHREKLIAIERSIKEMMRFTADYGKTLPSDSRERRDVDTNLARAVEVLAEIRRILT